MGLTATAYEHAELLVDHDPTHDDTDAGRDACHEADHIRAHLWREHYPTDPFADTQVGLNPGDVFAVTGATERVDCAYSSHNHLRRIVAAAIGYDLDVLHAREPGQFTGVPLIRWLDFADNEGTIPGPICAELATEHAAINDRVVAEIHRHHGTAALSSDSADFVVRYDLQRWQAWGRLFALAGPDGLINYR